MAISTPTNSPSKAPSPASLIGCGSTGVAGTAAGSATDSSVPALAMLTPRSEIR